MRAGAPRPAGWHVEAGDARTSLVGREQRREDAHDRRLARTVGSEQTEDAAGGDLEVEPVEGDDVAVALDESFGADFHR
jgi:hypothetical protein